MRRIFAPLRYGSAGGSLPAYLDGVDPLTWVAVASGTGRMSAKLPSPIPGLTSWSYTGSPYSYSGAVVDQVRKAMIICCQGGHTDWGGNEAYELDLDVDTPTWKRLTESSTDSVLAERNSTTEYTSAHVTLGEPAKNTDGIPHSFHGGTEQQWLNGRVWFTSQSSTATDSLAIPACFSFDRDSIGEPSSPLAYPDNAAPWRFHGNWNGSNTGEGLFFGCSAVDSQRNRVWGVESANYGRMWSLNTATGVSESSRLATFSIANFYPAMWACCAPDLGILVIGRGRWTEGSIAVPTVRVYDITSGSPVLIGDKTVPQTDTEGAPVYYDEVGYQVSDPFANDPCFQPSYGAVYHAASKSILLFEARRKPSGDIVQLRIPTSAGAYDSSGSWAVTLRPTANHSWTSAATISMYSRFNQIEDMGGEPVLIAAPNVDQPTYVCRIGSLA